MSSLEAKIKALLEGTNENSISEDDIKLLDEETIKTKSGTTITDDDEDQENDDHSEPDGDEDGEDDDTDFSKDTKKDSVKAIEEETKGMKQGADNVSGAADTSKIKAGQSRKDEVKSGKLKNDTSTGDIDSHEVKQLGKDSDGSADNSKIKAGLSRKDEVKTGKLSVKEHMDAIFNGEELSEEFMSKTQTIFEAAVEASAQARFEELKEEYEAKLNEQAEEISAQLDEAVEEVKSELVENVDGFLNYVVEQWVQDNQVALESGVKVDLVDSFIDGMKNLFKEHYIEVPNEKVNVIEAQDETIKGLSEEVETLEEQYAALQAELVAVKTESLFNKASSGMTAVQVSKFKDLAESIEFTDEADYVNKLNTIKESYFAQKSVRKSDDLNEGNTDSSRSESVNAYVNAISKNIKF